MAYAFNNDIFLTQSDRDVAKRAFPAVYFALDNPAMRTVFETFDVRANRAKGRSRRWGVTAVTLATIALMLGASSPMFATLSHEINRAIAILGAIFGIASVTIGYFGVMFRGRKLRWLTDRLATERMRQFHFQHFAAHGKSILEGARDEAAAARYIAKRTRDFERLNVNFLSRLEDEFHAIVEADDPGEGLMFDFMADLPDADDPNLEEYYRAYDLLRFQRQIDYCNLLLSEKRSLWKHAPARQARFFSAFGVVCLAVILGLDTLLFMGAIVDTPLASKPIFGVVGAWMAFLALFARTIEDGFQPGTEVERMRQYRIALTRSHARFLDAETPAERIEPISDLESASYEEMLPFLKTNFEARFVM